MNTPERIFSDEYLPLSRRMFCEAYGILANSDDAADAVQDAMTKIWQHRNKLREVDSPDAFAAIVVRRAAIDILRRRRPTVSTDEYAQMIIQSPQGVESGPDLLEAALAGLPGGQQEVMRLRIIDDLDTAEISAITGLSADNVRQHLSRARKKIREFFKKERI